MEGAFDSVELKVAVALETSVMLKLNKVELPLGVGVGLELADNEDEVDGPSESVGVWLSLAEREDDNEGVGDGLRESVGVGVGELDACGKLLSQTDAPGAEALCKLQAAQTLGVEAPRKGLYVCAGHSVQSAEETRPTLRPYEPLGQGLQPELDARPAREDHVPTGHCTHELIVRAELYGLYVPAGQGVHATAPVAEE